MENLINLSQTIVAISVVYVWTFRFHNVLKEFEQFGLRYNSKYCRSNKNISRDIAYCWYMVFILSTYSFHSYGSINDRCSIFSFKNK